MGRPCVESAKNRPKRRFHTPNSLVVTNSKLSARLMVAIQPLRHNSTCFAEEYPPLKPHLRVVGAKQLAKFIPTLPATRSRPNPSAGQRSRGCEIPLLTSDL